MHGCSSLVHRIIRPVINLLTAGHLRPRRLRQRIKSPAQINRLTLRHKNPPRNKYKRNLSNKKISISFIIKDSHSKIMQ